MKKKTIKKEHKKRVMWDYSNLSPAQFQEQLQLARVEFWKDGNITKEYLELEIEHGYCDETEAILWFHVVTQRPETQAEFDKRKTTATKRKITSKARKVKLKADTEAKERAELKRLQEKFK